MRMAATRFIIAAVIITGLVCLVFFFLAPVVLGVKVLSPLALASWSLGAISVMGFLLIGKGVWYSWFFNVFAQVLWIAFWIADRQPGLIITNVVYIMVFVQNAVKWSKDYNFTQKSIPSYQRRLRRLRDVNLDDDPNDVVIAKPESF